MSNPSRVARRWARDRLRGIVARKRLQFAPYLRGRGLEVGALQNPMALPGASKVLYSDILSAEQLDVTYPGSKHPDIISNSESFPTLHDGSLDFVVANHVLEHVSDPIRALQEWHRILRDGGRLMMAIPDKRFTFDYRRHRTPLSHLIADHESKLPAHELNKCHLLEWAEHVEGLVPGTVDFDRWISNQLARGYSVHNHVWVAQDIFDLLVWMAGNTSATFVLSKWCNSSPLGHEFVLLLRARKGGTSGSSGGGRFRLLLARCVALLQQPALQLSGMALRIIRSRRGRPAHAQ